MLLGDKIKNLSPLKFIYMKKSLFLIFIFVSLATIFTFAFKIIFDSVAVHSSIDELIKNDVNFWEIWKNNCLVCAVAIMGIFCYKIPTICVYFFNAFTLGFVLGINWAVTGEIIYFLKILIPHGIFEIPAIVISCALGFTSKEKIEKKKFVETCAIVYILITIAAIVECFVSTRFIGGA